MLAVNGSENFQMPDVGKDVEEKRFGVRSFPIGSEQNNKGLAMLVDAEVEGLHGVGMSYETATHNAAVLNALQQQVEDLRQKEELADAYIRFRRAEELKKRGPAVIMDYQLDPDHRKRWYEAMNKVHEATVAELNDRYDVVYNALTPPTAPQEEKR